MQLIITEKPSVAKSIADVMGATQKKEGYLEGNGILVSWCIGHLLELAPPESYGERWKKWTYESLPIIPDEWQHVLKPDTRKQYDVLYNLFHDERVTEVVCATDAGREGELIFRLVAKKTGCDKPVKRLWLSSLEEAAVKEGFASLKPGSDYDDLYHSALCRQEADWLVGINGTRLFSVLYGRTLKVGRVQTPTLAMLVERAEQIRTFVKEKYYVVHLLCDGVDAVTEKVRNKADADLIAGACQGRQAFVASVVKEEKVIAPPKLYDLTSLQREANRLLGFTAKQTLEYLQSLYEKKLITYPRTDSRFLTEDMARTAEDVINVICDTISFLSPERLQPDIGKVLNNSKVTDHHAIIPTVEIALMDLSTLPVTEWKLLSLVAGRLLCATGDQHLYESMKVQISCEGYNFAASGKTILQNGWKEYEEAFKQNFNLVEKKKSQETHVGEVKLPELSEGIFFDGVQTKISEHYTAPPKHYTEDSLLAAMEKAGSEETSFDAERKGLGTPATRADIIEKLVKDGYIRRENKQLMATEEGTKLITVLPDVIKSPKLTSDWENVLSLIAKGKQQRSTFMEGIENLITELVNTYHKIRDEPKNIIIVSQDSLGGCPSCGSAVYMGKYGAYCSGKCGMNVGKVLGKILTEEQVKDFLAGKKIFLQGLKGKLGKTYEAYLIPEGIETYTYKKGEQGGLGLQYKFRMEFPQYEKKK